MPGEAGPPGGRGGRPGGHHRGHGHKGGVEGMVFPGHPHAEAGLQMVLKEIPGVTKHGLLRHDTYYFQNGPLDEFGKDMSYNWIDYETIRKGTFTRDGGQQLDVVSFRTLVVDNNPSWASWRGGNHHVTGREPGGEAPNPLLVARDLERIFNAGTPLRLRVWNKALYRKPDVDMAVTFRTLSIREQHGEPDTRYFDMSFTEYREPQTKRRGYGKNKHRLPAVVQVKGNGVAVIVKRDGHAVDKDQRKSVGSDAHPATLRKLAKFFYGEHRAWVHIANKNGIKHFGPDDSLAKLRRRGKRFHKLTIPKWQQHDHGHHGGGDDH